MHHFLNVGLYDGLFIMQDTETESLWNHITGEAVYGELAGYTMPVSNLLQTNVRQALDMNPDMQIAISDRPVSGMSARLGPNNANAELSDPFSQTLGSEDTRRDRMEMGLGVWTEHSRKYYPMTTLREEGRVLIDEIGGKGLIVYLDPASSTPAAAYVEASSATLEGREIVLDGGRSIRAGMLVESDGSSNPLEQPLQIFTRWYGYALTFPGSEIYGE